MKIHQKYVKIVACVFLTVIFIFVWKGAGDEAPAPITVQRNPDMKYILLWTSPFNEPFKFIGDGQSGFIRRNCTYTNCFVTADRNYFDDYRKFHALVFAMSEYIGYKREKMPQYRSPEQKYVFSSVESSHYYPVCSDKFENHFNWTWSFRLDSDCRYEYIAIRDEDGNVIGPNTIMHWMDIKDMSPVSSDFKRSLHSKTKAAAWFVSNCYTRGKREVFVRNLQKELSKYKSYNYTIDIYGGCGTLKCPRGNKQMCFEMLKNDYFFYLSFENSFSVDYVTEKLLTALKNNAIPIVFGEANYTRFMPDGMYLNARTLGPKELAKQMDFLIRNPDKYAEYFKWKNHYSYHSRDESPETDDICAFCKLLNDEEKFMKKSIVKNFRSWWDNPKFC